MDPQVWVAVIGSVTTIIGYTVKVHRDNRKDHNATADVVREVLDDVREIKADTRDVKDDMREVKADVRSHGERLRRLETQTEPIHVKEHS